MTTPDYSQMTLVEAVAWAEKNTAHDDVCKRLRSRAVVRILYEHCRQLQAELQKSRALCNHAERIAARYQEEKL